MDTFDWANFDTSAPSTDWTSGFDLSGGGDTGNAVGPGSSFTVGPGQIPSDVYQQLLGLGGLAPGMSTSIPQGPSGGGGGGGSGGGRGSPGLFTNPDGSINWASLLGMLAPIAGGLYTANRTSAANQQMQQAIQNANAAITSNLGGNTALYQPYRDVGTVGLQRLTSMPQSNLAAKFPALGTPAAPGFSLGTIAKGK